MLNRSRQRLAVAETEFVEFFNALCERSVGGLDHFVTCLWVFRQHAESADDFGDFAAATADWVEHLLPRCQAALPTPDQSLGRVGLMQSQLQRAGPIQPQRVHLGGGNPVDQLRNPLDSIV